MTILRVHFFGGGTDPLSHLLHLAAWVTRRSDTYTHVAVEVRDFPDTVVETDELAPVTGHLFHLTLTNLECVPPSLGFDWFTRHAYIDVDLYPVTHDDVFNRIYGLDIGGARVTLTGLLDLLFRVDRYNRHCLVCTDLIFILMGTETIRSLTPDAMYTYLREYVKHDG